MVTIGSRAGQFVYLCSIRASTEFEGLASRAEVLMSKVIISWARIPLTLVFES